MIDRFRNVVADLCAKLNVLGEICIVICMFLVVINVFLRVLFESPMAGLVDYVGFLAALIVACSLAFTALREGHLEVDFIFNLFPKKLKRGIYTLISLFNFIFLALVSYFLFVYTYTSYVRNEVSMTAQIPAYPFIGVAAVGMLLFSLVTLGKFIQIVARTTTGKEVSK